MNTPEQTMIDNLLKNTGKSLEQWITIVQKEKFAKHGEIIKFLKEEHEFTHGFANLVAHKSKGSDAGSIENKDILIVQQYQGKDHLLPIYNHLITTILKFGDDIEIAPKNAYVSIIRKKQFAILKPASKTRFEIQLIIKNQEAKGILNTITTSNAMCTHVINISDFSQINDEVINWIKIAYEKAT
jgi:predicted transport protein